MELVNINGRDTLIKEYNGERVLTLKDIDLFHNRPEETAGRNFRKNKKHLIENVDFFFIKPNKNQTDEIRRFGINSPRGGYLITETGYLMLVKSFTDDLAWKVQRQLVNNYFRVKQEPTQLTIEPITELKTKTYKGIPVMVINDLAQVLGLSKYTAYWRVRQSNIPYIVLHGKNLFDFKAENSGFAVQTKSLAIMFYEDVLEFCRVLNLDTTMVIKYFEGSIPLNKDSKPKTNYIPSDEDYRKAEFMLKASQNIQDKKMANYVALEALKLITGNKIISDYDFKVVLNDFLNMAEGKSFEEISRMKKEILIKMEMENAGNQTKEFMLQVFDRAMLRKIF